MSISFAKFIFIEIIANKAKIPADMLVLKKELIPKLSHLIDTYFTASPIKNAAIASLNEPPNKNTNPKAPIAENKIVVLFEYLFSSSISLRASFNSSNVILSLFIFLAKSFTL